MTFSKLFERLSRVRSAVEAPDPRAADSAQSADRTATHLAWADPEHVAAVAEMFWIVLGREVEPHELRERLRGFRSTNAGELAVQLLSSPEFRSVFQAWKDGVGTGRDLRIEERALRALGPNERFVRRAYELLLGRPADDGGLRHFSGALAAGESRVNVLRSLALSDEFERRYLEMAPHGGFLPRDTQLCELANPAKWDNPEWIAFLRDLRLSDAKGSMHRKPYELTQLLYGLHKLGSLRDDASVLSVGAGHECVLYWLANHVGRVVATDLYEGIWRTVQSKEGDEGVIRRPEEYAPFPYRRDRLTFLKMDGRQLAFKNGLFDIVYSLSSIEHFGGLAGARTALDEMARVAAPGGLIVLATEYVIDGPPHDETFMPADVAALVDRPGLTLVQPIDNRVYDRYEYVAVDLYGNPYQAPHMVVRFDDTVFTSVMVFLRKA